MVKKISRIATILVRVSCLGLLFWTSGLIFVAMSVAQTDAETPAREQFVPITFGDYFSCEIPVKWSKGSPLYGDPQDDKNIYGITLDGPRWGELPLRISVNFFAEGNPLYRSIDHYLRLFAQPALGVALGGDSYGPVAVVTVSGRSAWVFERIKNEYLPLNNFDEPVIPDGRVYERKEMMARPVPARQKFVVIPAATGFYALRYSAPVEDFEEFLPDFERVTATFNALR